MAFVLSAKSLAKLDGVDPKLVAVVKRAIKISPIDFMVVQGLRSKEDAYTNWGKGRNVEQLIAAGVPNPSRYAQPTEPKVTWLAKPLGSKHITGKAVDLLPDPYDWKDVSRFKAVADAVKQAASELGAPVVWGGDWTSSKDYPHVELA